MAVRAESNAEPIPGYRLIDRLGGGGFGEVWRAVAPGGMEKAIKFVFGDLSNAGDNGQRAEQELKALKRVLMVRHPYILNLERYDIVDGQLMIVMELADRNLWDRFKECRSQGLPGIPRDELMKYMEESAEALDLMNQEHQLQHLDIKPQNIFLVGQHAKVADFGLVKDLEGSMASVTGGITPVYAAPETFDGRVSRFSDQYSLAILYQELLTGQRPFNGVNVRQLILQHLQATPNVSPLPPGDQGPILRSLSKEPNQRFPLCRDLVNALRAGQGTTDRPTAARPEEPLPAPVAPSSLGRLTWNQPAATSPAHPGGGRPPSPGGVAPPPGPASRVTTAPSGPPEEAGPLTRPIRTPQPETGAQHGTTQISGAGDAVVLPAGVLSGSYKAPPEVTGNGNLFPALVIGLGHMGMVALQRLRECLAGLAPHGQPGALDQLAHIRTLLVDTDPDVIRARPGGQPSARPGAAVGPAETVIAGLNRPSYYLKPRDGRPPLTAWLNPQMLYRIPRSQVTTGVRALGRLAFVDNYRTVARRIKLELETVLEPAALQAAARATKLGVRTNRPRVYIVTGLAGGTGSGMFLDVAYTVRALLRQMGYDPEAGGSQVVGLLLVPPVDGQRTRVLPLGNTYAALKELEYYGQPGTVFRARYHDREGAIEDAAPPFSRTILLPLPEETDEVAMQEVVDLAGQFLSRDLTGSLGRTADLARAGLAGPPWDSRGQFFQTFGLYQLTWPRGALLEVVGRRLAAQVVRRWMSKDAKPFRDALQQWVQEQWAEQGLTAEQFLTRLQGSVVQARGRPAEALFNAVLEPVTKAAAAARAKPGEVFTLPPDQVGTLLDQLVELVGKPTDEPHLPDSGALLGVLRETAEVLANEWGQKLAELPVHLIEDPAFRLAGAEESIRQFVATIEQVLQTHETLAQDLAEKAASAYARLRLHASPQVGRRPGLTGLDVAELLRAYPRHRFQAVAVGHLTAAFVGLRGHLSDELREVNYCRTRMAELLRLLEEPPPGVDLLTRKSWQGVTGADGSRRPGAVGRRLFLSGARDLRESVEAFLTGMTPEHLLDLDAKAEDMLRSKFRALVHVCTTADNMLHQVQTELQAVAREYAASYLPTTSVADLFFEQNPEKDAQLEELASVYQEAAPELVPGSRGPRTAPSAELCVVAAPPGAASEDLRDALAEALPDVELQHATSPDDVVVYRERVNLSLADLEQLGPVGQNAYAQLTAAERFTPHTRADVEFVQR